MTHKPIRSVWSGVNLFVRRCSKLDLIPRCFCRRPAISSDLVFPLLLCQSVPAAFVRPPLPISVQSNLESVASKTAVLRPLRESSFVRDPPNPASVAAGSEYSGPGFCFWEEFSPVRFWFFCLVRFCFMVQLCFRFGSSLSGRFGQVLSYSSVHCFLGLIHKPITIVLVRFDSQTSFYSIDVV